MPPKPRSKKACKDKATEPAPSKAKTKKNPSSRATSAVKTTKYVHTSNEQLRAMVEWLETPLNYKIIVGESTTGKTVSHGVGITKLDGFKRMASYVHQETLKHMSKPGTYDTVAAEKWSGQVCQSRWKAYFTRYKSTRDKLNGQTGFGITAEMYAQGFTLETMVEKACPYFYRLDKIVGAQANVEPASHTVEPESEEGDDWSWSYGTDASLPNNEEAPPASTEAEDLPSLDFELPNDVSASDVAQSVASVSNCTNAANVTTPLSVNSTLPNASLPALASRAKPDAVQRGDTRGSEKANSAKRRDFASIYTEASEKRLELSAKRMKQDLVLQEKKLEQEDRLRRLELEVHERDRLQRASDKTAEEKNRMALQLLLNGKSLLEVNEILSVFFPA